MCSSRSLFLQTGLQKMREPHIFCLEDGLGPTKRFGKDFAHHCGGFFHQIKSARKQEEMFIYKASSEE
jgi:hypothetical protein